MEQDQEHERLSIAEAKNEDEGRRLRLQSMAATVVPASYATLEVLELYNYDDWSLKVQNYLIGEGLWDVVDAMAKTPNNIEAEYMNWRMKNSKALYAIQISCRTDVFGFIGDIMMAKDAWATLAERLKPKNMSRSDIKGMAATLVPSEMFDLQALDKDNYERWRFWVETYLVAEKLWEVVEGTRKPRKQEDGEAIFMAWRKNNARALHIIILFCGENAKSCIRESETAKETWNTLAEEFSTPEIFETLGASTEVDPNDDDTSSNDGTAELIKEELEGSFPMFQYTENNEWEPLRKFVEQNPETVREKVCWGMIATSSSALVAALIITIMFAAVVTVPGGIDEHGIPIHLHTKSFRIFMIADVISLCLATTSVTVFLGILAPRFAEEDFLKSLSTKLIIGFLTLFLSMGSMMVAFSSAIYIMLPGQPSIVISTIVLASVPIASFLWMQFPFLIEIIISTYGPNFWYDYRRIQ